MYQHFELPFEVTRQDHNTAAKSMKTLAQQVNEVLKSSMNTEKKRIELIKLGITPYEAQCMATLVLNEPSDKFTFTFGVEIECYNFTRPSLIDTAACHGLMVRSEGYNHTDNQRYYKIVSDGSLTGENSQEVVSPVLRSEDGFDSLETLCQALARVHAKVNKSCGLHVHIGARNLTQKEYCNVFVNYMMLEEAISSFLAPSRRDSCSRWCKSLRNHKTAILAATTKNDIRCALEYDRYHRVNAEAYNRHNTIEFRQHQGTTDFTKISHWVTFLGKLVEYSKSNRLTKYIDRIEDIPFLSEDEKNYFMRRRTDLARTGE